MRNRTLKHIPILTVFALLGAVAASAANLLTVNPGFEEAEKGWQGVGSKYWTISKTAAPWRDGGEKALQRVAYKGSRAGSVWSRWNEQKIPVKAGEVYTLSAGLNGVGGGSGSWSICPVLQVLDVAGKEITVLEGEKLVRSGTSGRYSRLSANLTMPEGAAEVLVGVRVHIDKELTEIAYLRFDTLSLAVAEPPASADPSGGVEPPAPQ